MSLDGNDVAYVRTARLMRDAMFHAVRGLNELNDQSLRVWNQIEVSDAVYHLNAAAGYLNQVSELLGRGNTVADKLAERLETFADELDMVCARDHTNPTDIQKCSQYGHDLQRRR